MINFFREDKPESMSRLALFIIVLAIAFYVVYFTITNRIIDFSGVTLLLAAAFAGKVGNKFKENAKDIV
jgi:hypothetical protein